MAKKKVTEKRIPVEEVTSIPWDLWERLHCIEGEIEDLRAPEKDRLESSTSHITYQAMRTYIDVLEKNKRDVKDIAYELAVIVQNALLDCYSKDKKRGQKVMQAFVSEANSPTLSEPALWEH